MLKLLFLGTPIIQQNDEQLSLLNDSTISLRVLAFLICQRQQPTRRDMLAATFWPDLSDKRARQTLSNIVWRLRNGLQDAANELLVTNTTLQFNPNANIWLDVDAFKEASQSLLQESLHVIANWLDEAEQMLALYRGEFLVGIEDEWCVAKREELRQIHHILIANTIERYRASGNDQRAIYWANRAQQDAPDSEHSLRVLLELYIQSGNLLQARQTFEQYEKSCTEMKLTPSIQLLDFVSEQGLRPGKSRRKPKNSSTSILGQYDNLEYIRRELEIRRKNDELFDLMADRQQQNENLLYMQTLADKLNDPATKIDLLARRTWLATRKGDYESAIALAQDALAIANQSNEGRQRSLLHRLLGVASEESGDFRTARHHYKRAMVLDENLSDAHATAINLNNIAATNTANGNYCEAIKVLQTAEKQLSGQPVSTAQAKIAGNQAFAWMKLGQYQEAERLFQKAHHFARISGERDTEWWLILGTIQLQSCQKQLDESLKLAHHHYTVLQSEGDAWVHSAFANELANLYILKKDGKNGFLWAQKSLNYARERHQWLYQLRAFIHMAASCYLLQQRDKALDYAEQAVKQFEQKHQLLADAPLLYDVYAQCARANNEISIVKHAELQQQKAIQEQIELITVPSLRERFIASQLIILNS